MENDWKHYLEDVKDTGIKFLEVEQNFNDFVVHLEQREDNFNNCDKTSGQICYGEGEIKNMIEKCIKYLKVKNEIQNRR